ncbi:hypothetical protein RJ639_043233 [Escallonia herrerae]|uniref:Uncharacterized protein n=1 Tax=Escallonia herrerae TaxID=1293975 RepID=A0AA88WDM9_9ASTE|nr:hypothetical protein RJ639_043233 [Escallonia herrerae]
MEMEQSPPLIAKKLWNTVRIVFYMLRKGIAKSQFLVDLNMMLKRGKVASETIGNLMLHHHYAATLSCKSDDVRMSFVSPREYEFSCSNSPVYPTYYTRRKHHHHHHHGHSHRRYHHADDVKVVQKVFDILNNYEAATAVEASPLWLPGFGRSPAVRQLRVTDSPFPLKDAEENPLVDKAAEDFIKNFYKELKQQKKLAAIESPSPYHKWAR